MSSQTRGTTARATTPVIEQHDTKVSQVRQMLLPHPAVASSTSLKDDGRAVADDLVDNSNIVSVYPHADTLAPAGQRIHLPSDCRGLKPCARTHRSSRPRSVSPSPISLDSEHPHLPLVVRRVKAAVMTKWRWSEVHATVGS
jgi:hypothetical protein